MDFRWIIGVSFDDGSHRGPIKPFGWHLSWNLILFSLNVFNITDELSLHHLSILFSIISNGKLIEIHRKKETLPIEGVVKTSRSTFYIALMDYESWWKNYVCVNLSNECVFIFSLSRCRKFHCRIFFSLNDKTFTKHFHWDKLKIINF